MRPKSETKYDSVRNPLTYTKGNYYTHVQSRGAKDIEKKSAYIVGSGIAGLAAAAFLVRDAKMKGNKITVYEELDLPGGSLDGILTPHDGFKTRGGREMEDHFEVLWDLFRSIPSLEKKKEGWSVLDEFYWLNYDDPNISQTRIIHERGKQTEDDGNFTLSAKAQDEITKLLLIREDDLYGITIGEYFSDDFFKSNYWLYWASMFAFEPWHSVVEMRRYFARFIHHLKGLPDLAALKFNRYNQYESMVKPLIAYLKSFGVKFVYNTFVEDINVDVKKDSKVAKSMVLNSKGKKTTVKLTQNDLVFVTNGSITESSQDGNTDTPAPITSDPGPSWTLWENLAKQSKDFGNPGVFYKNLPKTSWFISATITWEDYRLIEPYMEKITKTKMMTGNVVTSGIVTVKDSSWLLSFATHRQPHFKEQNSKQATTWFYALYSATPGDYIKKPVEESTGREIAEELMFHMGVPENKIPEIAKKVTVVPTYLPFITSYFMNRQPKDRPAVIPNGSKNLAFIGNFAESPTRDTVFTTEYSTRTAMEAVYGLTGVERTIPEVFGSLYDMREVVHSIHVLADWNTVDESNWPFAKKRLAKIGINALRNSFIGDVLRDSGLTDVQPNGKPFAKLKNNKDGDNDRIQGILARDTPRMKNKNND